LKLERLLAAAERAADWEEVSRLCSQLGKRLVEQGKYREAIDYHRREVEVCQEHGEEDT